LIQDNILRINRSTPIEFVGFPGPTGIRTSSNLTPAGQIIEANDQTNPNNKAPDVGTRVNEELKEALLFRFL